MGEIWTHHASGYNTTFNLVNFWNFNFLEFYDHFMTPRNGQNRRKITKNGQKWSKIEILKIYQIKSFIMPRYMLCPNYIHVDAILAAGKFLEWLIQFFTISIFAPNFTLNYEGFSNFNVLPYDNERVFSSSERSDK